MMKTKDPVIDEIRRVRHEISAEAGHDSKRLAELLEPYSKLFTGKRISSPRPRVVTKIDDLHANPIS